MRKVLVLFEAWFRFTSFVLTEQESRRYVNGTAHDLMLFFLSAIVARHDNLKAPFRDTSLCVMKMRVLTENILNHILCRTSNRVRVVVPAQSIEGVFRESSTN
jgi:hypothetical protein